MSSKLEDYSNYLEHIVVTTATRIIQIEGAYRRFHRSILKAVDVSIRCGCLPAYIPCINAECQTKLEQYEESADPGDRPYFWSNDWVLGCRYNHAVDWNSRKREFDKSSWKCLVFISETILDAPVVRPKAVASCLTLSVRTLLEK